jgi:RNA polymerase sigma factor (TIGR02999 family)
MPPIINGVTGILQAIEQGDPHAAEQLLPLVYDELRKLAARKLAQEQPGQTLQATALVHEAYLRLVDGNQDQQWQSRRHFFAAAAEAMRRILIESARRKQTTKHGGHRQRIDLDQVQAAASSPATDLLALDEALTRLAAEDPVKAQLVSLRYFAGLSVQEAADTLGISRATADRYWAYARTWLYCALSGQEGNPGRETNSAGP